jgi:hypothetical protein
MIEYGLDNKVYIDIRDIRAECSVYCKGIRSNQQLLEKKNISDYIYGKIVDNKLERAKKLSRKFGSTFINKSAITELFQEDDQSKLEPLPPIIDDTDLVFFKDEDGREYNVTMRGTRIKTGIYFKVKDIMYLFEMPTLNNDMKHANSAFKDGKHYKYFNTYNSGTLQSYTGKEMYLTYDGLIQVINDSRSGIGYKFKTWIDDIVFAAAFGTKEQKIEVSKKILNVDADHLRSIMSKCPLDIKCIYLIDIKVNDGNKKVFKYGFTDNVQRRFREHMKSYGENIILDSFVFIPTLSLSKAETEFKNSISRYRFSSDQEKELISLCDESVVNVKTIFKTISERYTGNMKEQITYFENKMKDLAHQFELKIKDKDMEIIEWKHKYEMASKDVELLELRLQLLQTKIN